MAKYSTDNSLSLGTSLFLLVLINFYTSYLHAFTNEYESMNSSVYSKYIYDYDDRFLVNLPYSACIRDEIPDKYCPQLGLRMWMPTFQDLNKHLNFNETFLYDTSTRLVRKSQLQAIVDSYYLTPYIYKSYRLPEEGQLQYMFDNNLVERGGTGTEHWVTQGGQITVAVEGRGYEYVSDWYKAKLHRLVTDDIPDTCQNLNCKDFIDNREYTIVIWNGSGCNYSWNWRLEVTTKENKSYNYTVSGSAKIIVPGGMKKLDVGIQMLANPRAWRRDTNLTDRHDYSAYECYRSNRCTSGIHNEDHNSASCKANSKNITRTFYITGKEK